MTPNRAVTAILISSLAGCSSVPQHGAVNFYPANPEANAIGVLTGEYQADGPSLGSLRAVMPDGEVLTGQYAIVSADASGFGSIYTSVLTPLAAPASCTAEAVWPSARARAEPPCSAIAGTSMECEFYNDNVFNHGYGGCRSSRGAIFRLQF